MKYLNMALWLLKVSSCYIMAREGGPECEDDWMRMGDRAGGKEVDVHIWQMVI